MTAAEGLASWSSTVPERKGELMPNDSHIARLRTPEQLRQIAGNAEAAAAQKAAAESKQAEERHTAARKAFMERDVSPDGVDRLMDAVTRLAEQGKHEFLALQFPAELLKDGGRRVNNFEPDWPDSLNGFAKHAFDFYEAELKPLGYRLRAQILDYPGGRLGDVGLFLCW
jgi:hypothetical protein